MTLADALPILAAQNVVDGLGANTKAPAYFALCARGATDGANIIGGENRTRIGLPEQRSAFAGHVGQIVGVRAEKKMGGIDARANITCMANQHPLGYPAPVDGIGDAVRVYHSSLARQSESPVSVGGQATRPNPAGVWATALVGVMVDALGKSPVMRAVKSFRRFGSHDRGPFARLVRAGAALQARLQPAFSIIPSIPAEGFSPWR